MEERESQKARDERLLLLFKNLDTRNEGHLDLEGLRRGLKRINHRMSTPHFAFPLPRDLATQEVIRGYSSETRFSAALKDADHLLHDILTAVDTSKDGLIQYSEFKHFFEGADRELWRIFRSVDQDRNGKIDKGELRIALTRAGIAVDTNRLEEFFDSMDKNNDGVISFEEWRYGRWHSSLRIRQGKIRMCINVAL